MFHQLFIVATGIAFLSLASLTQPAQANTRIFASPHVQATGLTPYYQQRLRRMFPRAVIEVTAPLQITVRAAGSEAKTMVNLDNLLALLNQEPRNRQALVEKFLATSKSTMTMVMRHPGGGPVKATNLLPLVRSSDFFDSVRADQRPISRNLASGISIFFSHDSAASISYLQQDNARAIGLDEASLYQMSIRNFERLAARARVVRSGAHYRATVSDVSYSSSLPLTSSFYERMRKQLGAELIIALPQRDLVLIANADNSTAIAEIRSIAASSASPYWVSRNLYRWSGPSQLTPYY